MSEILDAVVIGAGQAGLAAGRSLQRRNANFVIVDSLEQVGGSWAKYYDSLTLFSPARYSSLPDLPFGGDPDRYPLRDEVIEYLQEYRSRFALPVELGRQVVGVDFASEYYTVNFADGAEIETRGLIIASGSFGKPFSPVIGGRQSFRHEVLHSSEYKNPRSFEGKRVVVVGAGNSAVQIAVELSAFADVNLSVRERLRFLPQKVLGKDIHWWFDTLHLNGTNLFSDHGVPVIDDGTYRHGIKQMGRPVQPVFTAFYDDGVVWPGGEREHVDAVIFATRFRPNLDFLSGLSPNANLDPTEHHKGISTRFPRLAFCGRSGQNGFASATLRGVGRDAELVVRHVLQKG